MTDARPRNARSRAGRVSLVAAAVLASAGAALGIIGASQVAPTEASASPSASVPAPAASSPVTTTEPSASPSPTTPPPPPDVTFTLVAAGDVLTHGPVNDSARTGDGYDYVPLMKGVRPYIEGADLALCHLESPVAPPGVEPSGYPIFAAPAQIVRDLGRVGWDGCSIASNHSVDKGLSGVESTLAAFDANRMQHAGTARSAEEGDRTTFYSVRTGTRTIKVAHLSFSYGTNGMPVGHPWEVDLFDADAADPTPIIDAARQARSEGADVVIASVHCCVEYRTEPSDAQREIAERIAASGQVDLYVGHHAHVPQPIELLPGGPSGDGMWTAFGLGNFLSNQSSDCCVPETSNGVLLAATVTVTPDGLVSVEPGWTAVTVDRLDGHRMHALTDIPDGTSTLSAAEVADRLRRVRDAVGDEATELPRPVGSLADQMYPQLRIPSA